MKITLPNGIVLDDGGTMCDTLRSRINYHGLENLRVFLATEPSGRQEWLLVEGESPVYANQSSEAMWCHIDILGRAAISSDRVDTAPE
jgi:hypothetical protein